MRLPRGATGFSNYTDPPLPDTDVRAFRGACFAAAREATGRVLEYQPPADLYHTFHTTVIAQDWDIPTIAVLCHVHLPLVAFAEPFEHRQIPTTFPEPPSWAHVFTPFGFRVLSSAELNTPMDKTDTTALAELERSAIRDWAPDRAGNVLFNFWD